MESGVPVCYVCGEHVGLNANGEPFVACHDCNFPICKTCFEYELKKGRKACPRCRNPYDDNLLDDVRKASGGRSTMAAHSDKSQFPKWYPVNRDTYIDRLSARAPEFYFSQKIDYLKDIVQPSFVKERRAMIRDYEEFKIRINALVAKAQKTLKKDGQCKMERLDQEITCVITLA
ncbi:hypothetical protein V6N13_011407 [Hibiscus sabdariffa]